MFWWILVKLVSTRRPRQGLCVRVGSLVTGSAVVVGAAAAMPLRVGIIQGTSMEPTLPSGHAFLYDRTYGRSNPLRGDVVVLKVGREVWIKRVYAVGGDSFWALREVMESGVRHDPIRPADRTRFVAHTTFCRARYGRDFRVVRVRVPHGKLFLIGDGTFSRDSRQCGP